MKNSFDQLCDQLSDSVSDMKQSAKLIKGSTQTMGPRSARLIKVIQRMELRCRQDQTKVDEELFHRQ